MSCSIRYKVFEIMMIFLKEYYSIYYLYKFPLSDHMNACASSLNVPNRRLVFYLFYNVLKHY